MRKVTGADCDSRGGSTRWRRRGADSAAGAECAGYDHAERRSRGGESPGRREASVAFLGLSSQAKREPALSEVEGDPWFPFAPTLICAAGKSPPGPSLRSGRQASEIYLSLKRTTWNDHSTIAISHLTRIGNLLFSRVCFCEELLHKGIAIYPGSFDPTIQRAPRSGWSGGPRFLKSLWLRFCGTRRRLRCSAWPSGWRCCGNSPGTLSNVRIDTFDGLMVEYAKSLDASLHSARHSRHQRL